MKKSTDIPCIALDYGGTLDTNGIHWSEILWQKYQYLHIPISKDTFREAYIYGEKTLSSKTLILPEHTFLDVLLIKCNLQFEFLQEKGYVNQYPEIRNYPEKIAQDCYAHVKTVIKTTKSILEDLSKDHQLILVSNFYGNLHSVLDDLGILPYFNHIIESASVGVRKPNPEIFWIAARTSNCPPEKMTVVGDSFSKDIMPAHSIGSHTIWLKGKGWEENDEDLSIPDAIISDIRQLPLTLKGLNHTEKRLR